MKILRILSFVVALIALGYFAWQYFGHPNGKKYDVNKHQNIYYKGDGIEESHIQKLASYLLEAEYFGGDRELSVQVTKEAETKDTININYVVDGSKLTPKIESIFLDISAPISQRAFNGAPVNVNFIDDHFKMIKKLGYAPPLMPEAPAQETPAQ
jgi:hypothetical protein